MEHVDSAKELFTEYYGIMEKMAAEYYEAINEWIRQTGTELQVFMAVCTTATVMMAGYMLVGGSKKKKEKEQPKEAVADTEPTLIQEDVSKEETVREPTPEPAAPPSPDISDKDPQDVTREDTLPQQNGYSDPQPGESSAFYEDELQKRDNLIERLERELQASADAINERDDRLATLSRDLHAVREADRAVSETISTIASSTNNNPEVIELRERIKDREEALHRYRMETESMSEKIMDQMMRIDSLTASNADLEDRAMSAEAALAEVNSYQSRNDSEISSIRRKYLEAENERERLEHQHREDAYQLSQLRIAHQQEIEAIRDARLHESPPPPSPPSPSIINELNHLRQKEAMLREQESELINLQDTCSKLEARNQQLENDNSEKASLEARCASLQEMLASSRERVAALEKQQHSAPVSLPQRSSSSIPPQNSGFGSPSRTTSSPSQVEKLRMSHGLIGNPKVSQPAAAPPALSSDHRALYIYSEEKPILQGEYRRCGVHNGYPMWANGSFRVFSSTEGFWMVSADAEGPTRNVGRLVSSTTHEGASPDKMTSWDYSNGSNWETSKSTRISASRNPLPVFGSPGAMSPDSSSSRGSSYSPAEKRFPVPSCIPRLSLPAVDESRALDYGFPRGWRASETGRVTAPDGRVLSTVHEGLSYLHRGNKSPSGSPGRRSQVCALFAAGRCNSGSTCPLLHELVSSLPRERSTSGPYLISPPAGSM